MKPIKKEKTDYINIFYYRYYGEAYYKFPWLISLPNIFSDLLFQSAMMR